MLDAGGLDLAVEAVFGGRTVWHSESDPAAIKVLEHHWPDVPNLGDITQVDWTKVEPVDVLCGGFPCVDVSAAGKRAGLHGTRSGLWSHMRDAIDTLRPGYVVIENVKGLLNANANRPLESATNTVGDNNSQPVLRAAGAVLGDLADIGSYDARWVTVAASAVGAPHRRERVFILAANTDCREGEQPHGHQGVRRRGQNTEQTRVGDSGTVELLPTPTSRDHKGRNQRDDETCLTGALLPTPAAADGRRGQDFARQGRDGSGGDDLVTIAVKAERDRQWGKYGPAIRRWETITQTPAPAPTEPNRNGNPRLNPEFSSWMMGWPPGWVTGTPGVSRNDQLRIIGNGVVTLCAQAALTYLLATTTTTMKETP